MKFAVSENPPSRSCCHFILGRRSNDTIAQMSEIPLIGIKDLGNTGDNERCSICMIGVPKTIRSTSVTFWIETMAKHQDCCMEPRGCMQFIEDFDYMTSDCFPADTQFLGDGLVA
jgi:hypothetical protein